MQKPIKEEELLLSVRHKPDNSSPFSVSLRTTTQRTPSSSSASLLSLCPQQQAAHGVRAEAVPDQDPKWSHNTSGGILARNQFITCPLASFHKASVKAVNYEKSQRSSMMNTKSITMPSLPLPWPSYSTLTWILRPWVGTTAYELVRPESS